MVGLLYFDMGLRVITIACTFMFLINIKGNINFVKTKLMKNPIYLRFVTPSRREMEFVTSLNDNLYKKKFSGKDRAFIVNPNAMNFKSANNQWIKNTKEQKKAGLTTGDLTLKQILSKYADKFYLKGKVPVLTFKTTDSVPVNPYSDKGDTLSSEMYADQLVSAEATADVDFFKKLFGYRHVWMIAVAIAIGVGATLLFVFQLNNYINTIELCKIPVAGAKAVAEGAKTIVANP